MGAWGFKALDSDQALDWIGDTLDPVADKINELLDRIDGKRYWDEGELRAAAHLFCATNLDFHCMRKCESHPNGHMRDRLIAALTAYVNDREAMASWSDPQEARVEIEAEIEALRDPEGHGQPRSTTLMENLGDA